MQVLLSRKFLHNVTTIFFNSFMTEVLIIQKPSIDLQSKLMDLFPYDRDHRHERVKARHIFLNELKAA